MMYPSCCGNPECMGDPCLACSRPTTLKDVKSWEAVRPAEKVPEELRDKWGGEWGCPIIDESREVIGYAARMPQSDDDLDDIEVILL